MGGAAPAAGRRARHHRSLRRIMLRPGSWTNPAGASPVRVSAGTPGSRPRFVAERRRAERGVESLFGGSKRVGRRTTRSEPCSLVRFTMGEPSRSCHGEGPCPTCWPVPEMPLVGSPRGTGSGTHARVGSEQERPVWPALSAKTGGITSGEVRRRSAGVRRGRSSWEGVVCPSTREGPRLRSGR